MVCMGCLVFGLEEGSMTVSDANELENHAHGVEAVDRLLRLAALSELVAFRDRLGIISDQMGQSMAPELAQSDAFGEQWYQGLRYLQEALCSFDSICIN
jgi:hypothetical protein